MTAPEHQFVSYAYQDRDRKAIKKYAKQYDGVDMVKRMGADEENFPIRIKMDDDFGLLLWSPFHGIMMQIDEDCVRSHATKEYLLQNASPVFDSIAEAEAYAIEYDWPRKPWPSEEVGSNKTMDVRTGNG